jgi:hypothetical protein
VSKAQFILTTRLGQEIRDPSDVDLRLALEEVLVVSASEAASPAFDEHPNAWVRLIQGTGEMLILDVYRNGSMLFEQWGDASYQRAIAAPQRLDRVSFDLVLRLWSLLRAGNVQALHSEAWKPD